ncbi:hypothetical protein IVA98_18805 [Bradyrhizobium sp. 160]|nr:hypothetical protein [Bradyrhizobium sp. 160]
MIDLTRRALVVHRKRRHDRNHLRRDLAIPGIAIEGVSRSLRVFGPICHGKFSIENG